MVGIDLSHLALLVDNERPLSSMWIEIIEVDAPLFPFHDRRHRTTASPFIQSLFFRVDKRVPCSLPPEDFDSLDQVLPLIQQSYPFYRRLRYSNHTCQRTRSFGGFQGLYMPDWVLTPTMAPFDSVSRISRRRCPYAPCVRVVFYLIS